MMGNIPQSEENLAFASVDLEEGCRTGIYREVSKFYAEKAMEKGSIISSAFVVWQESSEGRKGRFVVNLSKQSKHWEKGSVRMESVSGFATEIQRFDDFLSMDIRNGYRHFRLAPQMRDWFIFHYAGRYYQCVALPFGWGRSPLWFTQLMATFVKELRRSELRVLAYLDDFLLVPTTSGIVSRHEDCLRAAKFVDALMLRLGLTRHPTKGGVEGQSSYRAPWNGARQSEHAFLYRSSKVRERKEAGGEAASRSSARATVGWQERVDTLLWCVCLTYPSHALGTVLHTFFILGHVCLSTERCPGASAPQSSEHSRSAQVAGFGERGAGWEANGTSRTTGGVAYGCGRRGVWGTLNVENLSPGVDGPWRAQGIWSWKDRAESISYRELKAIRMLLSGPLGKQLVASGKRSLLLHIDNQPVVHIANALVSASRSMMRELRRLKAVLDHHGIQIRADWIPSVANKFADGLSRRFPTGDLQIRRQLRRSVQAGMRVPLHVFPYRPVGEHPVFLRRQAFAELAADWDKGEVRLLCLPVDLISPTVHRLRQTGAPAILLISEWPRQAWHAAALQLATRTEVLETLPEAIWAAHRRLNPRWRLRLLEINLA